MKLVSVIVPVYNTEKYLSECIDSLICQTYENIEIILIDDGSIDNSPNICDNFSKKDNRIKVIHKLNSGVSSARNYGLAVCTGELIMFVDSDDYLEKNFVEKLVSNMSDNRMIICGYYENYPSIKEEKIGKSKRIKGYKEMTKCLLTDSSVSGFLWNKLFISKIIKNNKIQFNSDLHYCEDLLFILQYLKYVDEIRIIPHCLYNYRMRKSSATWNIDGKKAENLILCCSEIEKILKNNNAYGTEYLFYKLNILYKYPIDKIRLKTKSEYKKVINDTKITFKNKLKLYVMKNFRIVYVIYMKFKVRKKSLYI